MGGMSVFTSAIPPSFGGDHWFYAASMFGLIAVTALSLDWLWKIAWSFRESPFPRRHPITMIRIALACMLLGTLVRIVPDTILAMTWPDIQPGARFAITRFDRIMDALSVIPVMGAWLIAMGAGPEIFRQLARSLRPMDYLPCVSTLKRPLMAGGTILAISSALAFLR